MLRNRWSWALLWTVFGVLNLGVFLAGFVTGDVDSMVVTIAVAFFYPSHFLTFSVKSDHVVKRALEVVFMLLAIGAVIYGYAITGSPILGLFTMSFGAIVFVAFKLSYLLPRIRSKSSARG